MTAALEGFSCELSLADACVAPVYRLDEALRDAHHAARSMFVDVEHPVFGKIPTIGVAKAFGDAGQRSHGAAEPWPGHRSGAGEPGLRRGAHC